MQRIQVVDEYHSALDFGITLRPGRPGPESILIDTFLNDVRFEIPRGHRLTIFREPKIESGYPDLVFVVWQYNIANNWKASRRKLSVTDLRLMHFIYNNHRVSFDTLSTFFPNGLSNIIDNLYNANMIIIKNDYVTSKPLSKIFAVRAIHAVEAKINAFKIALRQAFLNTWFASISSLLIPNKGSINTVITTAKSIGLDVLTPDDNRIRYSSIRNDKLPLSYASWQFNEYVWRASFL